MYAKILVPVDGSGTSVRGLEEALKLAKIHGSQLCLFHIVNEFVFDYTYSPGLYTNQLVESLCARGKEILEHAASLARKQSIPAECVMLESIGGAASDMILEQAKNWSADLIVMGTHGRRGLRRLALGSDAEGVLRFATVPVLLVRSEDTSPVSAQNRSAA